MLENMPPMWFVKMQKECPSVPEGIPYVRHLGEFNPNIVRVFVDKYGAKGMVFWEPFAGHLGLNHTIEICATHGVRLIACDIASCDERVIRANSISTRPSEPIDGMIFHPPYYGSAPMSNVEGEISLDYDNYFGNLEMVADNADMIMKVGSHVCSVGRTLTVEGDKYRLDWIFAKLFIDRGYEVVDVFGSMPDCVVILEKKR